MGHRESLKPSPGGPRYTSQGIKVPGWSKPPFSFEGVTMRVFPLRADRYLLQALVDKNLNLFPQDAQFRSFLPYVYVMVLDYGKMAMDAQNLGWIAQHEVTFSIALEWYARNDDGQMEFRDWAYWSPFIFVDNVLSMTVGRQVYGWPKKLAYLNEETSTWMKDPRLPAKLAGIRTGAYKKLYAGLQPDFRTFLEVEQRDSTPLLQFPLDVNAPWWPWKSIPQAIVSSSGLVRDYMEILAGMGILQSNEKMGPRTWGAMASRMVQMFNPRNPDIAYNTINLKEFRDAEHVDQACYQAVTNAQMRLKRVNGGGMLGDMRVLTGDPAGGFRLKLFDYPSLPIVSALGLKTKTEEVVDGMRAYTVEPVFPFWMDVDMDYNLGTVLASYPPRQPRAPGEHPKRGDETAPIRGSVGLSGQEVTGPFDFPEATVRVMPLRADAAKLREFVKIYPDGICREMQGEGLEIEAWGEYVYLVATSYGKMASETNNVGYWAERELTCFVPVRVYGPKDEHGQRPLKTTALVPVFAYADSSTAAFSGSEVLGIPMVRADIESPPSTWMDQSGPDADTVQSLLKLKTIILPVLGMGQPAEDRVLVEVLNGEILPPSEVDKRRIAAHTWGERLRQDVRARNTLMPHDLKIGRAIAAEILSGELPINVLTVKEFRDCEDPDLACYQGLVNIRHELREVLDLREIDTPVHVRIHSYPSQPIVDSLGLIPKTQEIEKGTVVSSFEAVRPFWMKVNLRTNTGHTLFWRTVKRQWTAGERNWHCYFDKEHAPVARAELDDVLAQKPPEDLAYIFRQWKEEHAAERAETARAFQQEAVGAIERLQPQAVLETILSREWERRGGAEWTKALHNILNEVVTILRMEDPRKMQKAALDKLAHLEQEARTQNPHPVIREQLLGKGGTGGVIEILQESLRNLPKARKQPAKTPAGEAASAGEDGAPAALGTKATSVLLGGMLSALDAPEGSAPVLMPLDLLEGVLTSLDESRGEPPQPSDMQAALAKGAVLGAAKVAAPSSQRSVFELGTQLLSLVARARQKPDFCVRRSSLLGLDVPDDEIFNKDWYVGRDLREEHAKLAEPPAPKGSKRTISRK